MSYNSNYPDGLSGYDIDYIEGTGYYATMDSVREAIDDDYAGEFELSIKNMPLDSCIIKRKDGTSYPSLGIPSGYYEYIEDVEGDDRNLNIIPSRTAASFVKPADISDISDELDIWLDENLEGKVIDINKKYHLSGTVILDITYDGWDGDEDWVCPDYRVKVSKFKDMKIF